MLRYILVKLPGFTCISDVPAPSSCHVRMLRSLSPVKHECREERRNDVTKHAYKRSFSYPSARPQSVNLPERWQRLYSGNKLQDTKCENVTNRKYLPQKYKRTTKNQTEHVEVEKHKERAKIGLDNSKEFLLAQKEMDEKFNETFEVSEQYELEAAKPRKSQSELTFNVFEMIDRGERKPNPIEHLQPNNLKPFGSTENVQNPLLIRSRSSTLLRFPQGYDEIEQQHTSDKKYRKAEDIQHRDYSTSSRSSLFRYEDHVEMIRSLPPISISKYNVSNASSLCKTRIDKIEQERSEGDIDDVKPDKLRKVPFEGQSGTNLCTHLKLPWTRDDYAELETKEDDEGVLTEKPEVVANTKPLETPWPSYSDILKGHVHNTKTEYNVKSVRSITEPNLLGIELGSIDMPTSSTEKLQQVGKQLDDKLAKRSNFLQKACTLSQKRALSTEPVLTSRYPLKPSQRAAPRINQEKSSVQTKFYSRKSRPLEPESFGEEKPSEKCFLPSKIRLKPPLCTPKPKPCPIPEPCVRADDCLKIVPKRLPQLPMSSCPCIEPPVPEINPRLKRLEMHFQDPPRECPCAPCPCPPRADDTLVEKPKKLSPLKQGDCICVEAPPMVDVPLRRLQKICLPEEKCYAPVPCPKEEPCVRADDTLKVCEKQLPKLRVSPCPCIDQPVPDKNPKMRRLRFAFKDPPKVCPCEPTCPCPPRADDSIIEKTKKLPLYIPGDCACIEPPPMIDVPLKRLQKVCIPEEKCYPVEECPKPEPCVRADDCLKEEVKSLPILKPSECVCKEPYVPDKVPRMRRLEMDFKDEPKICPCVPNCPCPPRADDAQPYKSKKLPQLVAGECPCIESPPLVDVPLKRLQKVCVPIEKCYPAKECPPPEPCPRADDDACVKPKELPILEAKFCPCVEELPMKESPALRRLNLKVPEPPKVCPKSCVCEEDCPRADAQLEERKKSLPLLKAGDCPCIDKPMVDVSPLKRLRCEEEQEDCLTADPCMDYPRADMGCWEYWTPEKNKCKSGEKPKKKSGVAVNTKRKFNTDSKARLYDEVKKFGQARGRTEHYSVTPKEPSYENPNSFEESEDFNRVSDTWREKNGWVVKKAEIIDETPRIQVYRNPLLESTPTVFLLKQLDNVEEKKPKKIAFKVGKAKKLDVKRILEPNSGQNDQQGPISLPNVRNLSTDVQIVCNARPMSSDKRASKKKKTTIKKKVTCHKIGETCELNSKLPCVSTKCSKSCEKKTKISLSCDKKNSPYPAFSEVMEEEVEPFSDNAQWTCNRKEFGFHPRYKRLNNPFSADKERKNYTTTTLRGSILAAGINGDPKGTLSVQHKPKHPNNSGDPDMMTVSKKCSHQTRKYGKNVAYLVTSPDYVSSKYSDSNKKSNFAVIGANINFPKIFSMNSNSPLSSKLPNRIPPQHSIQIVRTICINAFKKTNKITKNVSHRKNSTYSKKEKSKKCNKKKKCPKFKLENCPPPEIRPACKMKQPPVVCDKSEAPYPAFTDCLDEELAENLSECPLEIEKVRNLQPKYIQPLGTPKLVKPVVPILGKIDLKKEESCIREKLCLKNKGLSQTCEEFGKPQKPMRAKHYTKMKEKESDKTEELKNPGKLPPKNSRGLCTSTANFLISQKRNASKFAKKPQFLEEAQKVEKFERKENPKKIHTLFQRNVEVRNYHLLCMKPMKKLSEDNNKDHGEQNHVITEDDCCRYKKLRNVQWRINNFQKWHRLNKLSSLPGYVKRFYSNMDMRNICLNDKHGKKTFSTSATNMISPCETPDIPMHRGISTTFILARAKKDKIEYIHVRKGKKKTKVSKSCPKFALDDSSPRKHLDCSKKKYAKKPCQKREPPYTAFSSCYRGSSESKFTECAIVEEQTKHLQPQYPILPEIETPAPDLTFQGKLDPTIETEYARRKYGIEKLGLTQHCSNFGEKIKPLQVRMSMAGAKIDNCSKAKDHQTFSVVVPEVHSTCSKFGEVPNVHFSSSAEMENVARVDVSRIHTNCFDKAKDKTEPLDSAQCIETELSRKPESTTPSPYKTCPEPPRDSQITQHSCRGLRAQNEADECALEEELNMKCPQQDECFCPTSKKKSSKSLWQKISSYFKARPNCPSPDEWKKRAAKAKAEKYAKVAGLVVVDPKDLPPKKEKCVAADDLPTVITHHSCYSHKKSIANSGRKSFSTTTIIKHYNPERNGTCWCGNGWNNVTGNYQRPSRTLSEVDVIPSVHHWNIVPCGTPYMGEESACEHSPNVRGNYREEIGEDDKDKSNRSLIEEALTGNDSSFNTETPSMELSEVTTRKFGGMYTEGYKDLQGSLNDDDQVSRKFIPEGAALSENAGQNGVFLSSLGAASKDDGADDSSSIDENKGLTRELGENHNNNINMSTNAHDCEAEIENIVIPTTFLDSPYNAEPNDYDSFEYFAEEPKYPNSNYGNDLDEINILFGNPPVSTVSRNALDNCPNQNPDDMKKRIGITNGKSPFLTVMRRYYSKNARCRNLEEINESLEEEEKKKKLAKKVEKSFKERPNVLNEHGYDDISITSQKNAEALEDGDSLRSNFQSEDDVLNRSCNISYRKPSFLEVIFQEPLHGISGYNQAKTFAAFQEYFHRIEVLSDISYEEIERVKTSNLVKELNKLIIDNKKQKRKS